MGYELDQLMAIYGLTTPTVAMYTGSPNSASDKAAYDDYVAEYKRRLFSKPASVLGALSAPAPTQPAPTQPASGGAPLQAPVPLTAPVPTTTAEPAATTTTTATPAERQFQWMPADLGALYNTRSPTTGWFDYTSVMSQNWNGQDFQPVTYSIDQGGYDAAVRRGLLNPNDYLFRNGTLYDKQYYAHGGSVHDLAAKYDEGGLIGVNYPRVSFSPMDTNTGLTPGGINAPELRYVPPKPEAAQAAPASTAPPPTRDALYEKYSADRVAAQDRLRDQSAAFAKMFESSLNSPAADEASKSEMYFRLAAALGSPTKTGTLGETVGLVGSQMGEYQQTKHALEANKAKMRLEAQKYQVASAKEDLDAAQAAEANYIALERENQKIEEARRRFEKEMQLKEKEIATNTALKKEEIAARRDIAAQAAADRAQAQADRREDRQQMYEDKKAAQEQKNYEKYVDKKANVTEVNAKLGETRKLVLELADHPGLNEITGRVGQFAPNWLLSPQGRNALELYDQIKAQGGFDALSSLKREGVTLGQVSNKEGTDLRQSWGALGRSKEAVDLKKELNRKANAISASQKRINDAFDEHYKRTYALPVPGESTSQTTPAAASSTTTPVKKPVNFGTLKIR